MQVMKNRKLLACVVAAGLILGACGTGSESNQNDESRNAVITKGWTYPLLTNTIGTSKSFRRVAVGADGTVYAVHDFSSEASGLGGVGVDVMLIQFSSDGRSQWSRRIGSTTSDETVDGLAVDDGGNVWVAGTTAGNMAVAPQGRDVWVRSFSAAGTAGVSTQLAAKGDQHVAGFAWDSAAQSALVGVNGGDVDRTVRSVAPNGEWKQVVQVDGLQIVTVESDNSGSILVGSIEMETSQVATGPVTHKTSFITRYSPAGRVAWKTRIGIATPSTMGTVASGFGDDILRDVSVAADGTVYAVGNLAPPVSTAFEAGFLVRLDINSGSLGWKRLLTALDSPNGAAKGTYVRTVGVTAVGDVWVTGESKQGFDADFSGTTTSAFALKFNSGGGQTALRQELSPVYNMTVQDAAVTPDDTLVYALFQGANGTALTSLADLPAEPIIDGAESVEQFGSFGPDKAIDIAVREDGGYFAAVQVATDDTAGTSFSFQDRLIARGPGAQWDSAVNVGLSTGRIVAIDTAPDGSVVAVGTYRVTPASTGVAEDDVWVTKVDRNGSRVWLETLRAVGNQQVTGVAVDSNGNMLVSGMSPTLLGSGAATSANSFVAVLNPSGSTSNIVQWGGPLADVTSRPVPLANREFVVASIEETGETAGRGRINIKRYSYDGSLIGENRPDDVPVYAAPPRLAQLTNGAFVAMSTTPVLVGVATTAQLRWHRWTTDFSTSTSQTFPKFSRLHQDCISDLEALPNGEVLMAGTSPCTSSVAQITRNSGFLLRLGNLGNVIDTRMSGKSLYDTYSAIDSLANGAYHVAGTMTALVLDSAPGSGDVLVRRYPGTPAVGGGTSTTAAPVTTAVPTTTGVPVTSVVPSTTAAPTTTAAPATTVAVSPGPTTVMTVPASLDETATDLAGAPGGFRSEVGGETVTGTVRESGQVVIDRPTTVPASKPFVTSLLPGNRSVNVTWGAVPGATSYTVTASGGRMQSCATSTTTCSVTGLVPGYPYQFVVTAQAGETTSSDPSLPVKPVLFLKRSSSVAANKVIPAPTDRSTKVKWKSRGVCKVSGAGRITSAKKAGKCTVTRTTSKTKSNPATKMTFTVVVR